MRKGVIPITSMAATSMIAAVFSFQRASLNSKYASCSTGPMMTLPMARKMYTAVTTMEAVAAIVATLCRVPPFSQLPINTIISATKPLKPGRPKEVRPAIINTVEINGMVLSKPPILSTMRVWVRSYTMPITAKKSAVIKPCDTI